MTVEMDSDRTVACPDESRVVEYMGGHLPTGDRARLEDHLDRCPPCRVMVAALARAVAPRGDSARRRKDVPQARGFRDDRRRTAQVASHDGALRGECGSPGQIPQRANRF